MGDGFSCDVIGPTLGSGKVIGVAGRRVRVRLKNGLVVDATVPPGKSVPQIGEDVFVGGGQRVLYGMKPRVSPLQAKPLNSNPGGMRIPSRFSGYSEHWGESFTLVVDGSVSLTLREFFAGVMFVERSGAQVKLTAVAGSARLAFVPWCQEDGEVFQFAGEELNGDVYIYDVSGNIQGYSSVSDALHSLTCHCVYPDDPSCITPRSQKRLHLDTALSSFRAAGEPSYGNTVIRTTVGDCPNRIPSLTECTLAVPGVGDKIAAAYKGQILPGPFWHYDWRSYDFYHESWIADYVNVYDEIPMLCYVVPPVPVDIVEARDDLWDYGLLSVWEAKLHDIPGVDATISFTDSASLTLQYSFDVSSFSVTETVDYTYTSPKQTLWDTYVYAGCSSVGWYIDGAHFANHSTSSVYACYREEDNKDVYTPAFLPGVNPNDDSPKIGVKRDGYSDSVRIANDLGVYVLPDPTGAAIVGDSFFVRSGGHLYVFWKSGAVRVPWADIVDEAKSVYSPAATTNVKEKVYLFDNPSYRYPYYPLLIYFTDTSSGFSVSIAPMPLIPRVKSMRTDGIADKTFGEVFCRIKPDVIIGADSHIATDAAPSYWFKAFYDQESKIGVVPDGFAVGEFRPIEWKNPGQGRQRRFVLKDGESVSVHLPSTLINLILLKVSSIDKHGSVSFGGGFYGHRRGDYFVVSQDKAMESDLLEISYSVTRPNASYSPKPLIFELEGFAYGPSVRLMLADYKGDGNIVVYAEKV